MDIVIGRDEITSVPRARLVFQDVLYVRSMLEDETRQIEWRLAWVLAVTLLRSIGYVLRNVDGKRDPIVETVAAEHHRSWKIDEAHAIFREFIEAERHSILKEYEFAVTEGPVPIMAHLQQSDGFDNARQFLLEENLYRPIMDGQHAGADGRELVDLAIEWWRAELAAIDAEVSRRRSI